ncbi:hypothetical protein AOA80_10970 [Methanomassiliicoccales archaeon RumEn M1]|jgi:hypothetical protein|nr:hypothetical protein AOA80_10970 [Methanomassiliicoccales archaeon RumEn M1]
MTKTRVDKKVTKWQVRRSASALMDKDLYLPTDDECAPFCSGNGVQDPRFLIEHMLIDEKGMVTQHPYGASMKEMKALIEWCEEHGYDFFVTGCSEYFPGATFKITFSKSLTDTDVTTNGS